MEDFKGKSIMPESKPFTNSNGYRVLLVEYNRTCQFIMETMLRSCGYQVTSCRESKTALTLLKTNQSMYDIMISNMHMPDMQELKLLETVKKGLNFPVIMVLSLGNADAILKLMKNGASDCLVMPIEKNDVEFLWKNLVRKREENILSVPLLQNNIPPSNNVGYGALMKAEGKIEVKKLERVNVNHDVQNVPLTNAGDETPVSHDEDEGKDLRDLTKAKKPRLAWTEELRKMFDMAVEQLRDENSDIVPKKIQEKMQNMGANVTRENVASHLQKYRMHKKGTEQRQSMSSPSYELMSWNQQRQVSTVVMDEEPFLRAPLVADYQSPPNQTIIANENNEPSCFSSEIQALETSILIDNLNSQQDLVERLILLKK